jgi:hypothetical protein
MTRRSFAGGRLLLFEHPQVFESSPEEGRGRGEGEDENGSEEEGHDIAESCRERREWEEVGLDLQG